jgi:hypothetical protein
VGDFNTPLLPIERTSKHKINKEILELNDTVNQIDLRGDNNKHHGNPGNHQRLL